MLTEAAEAGGDSVKFDLLDAVSLAAVGHVIAAEQPQRGALKPKAPLQGHPREGTRTAAPPAGGLPMQASGDLAQPSEARRDRVHLHLLPAEAARRPPARLQHRVRPEHRQRGRLRIKRHGTACGRHPPSTEGARDRHLHQLHAATALIAVALRVGELRIFVPVRRKKFVTSVKRGRSPFRVRALVEQIAPFTPTQRTAQWRYCPSSTE